MLGWVIICFSNCLSAKDLRVATAANFKATLERIVSQYQHTGGADRVAIITASSGVLFTQIRHGAPFDIFLSADASKPLQLAAQHPSDSFVYAIGRLAFWAPGQTRVDRQSLLAFQSRLAIANPRVAPYGAAAIESLRQLKPGFNELVLGKNINQAFQFVESGNAAAGLIALSQLTQAANDAYWLIPETLHRPIEQRGILLNLDSRGAADFVAFLQSPMARVEIARSGYELPVSAAHH